MYSCTSRLRSPLAPNHSWVSRMIPRRSARSRFSTHRPGSSSRYAQEKGQEFVAQGVLQAGELGAEGLEAFDSFRRGELFREPFAVDCFGSPKNRCVTAAR